MTYYERNKEKIIVLIGFKIPNNIKNINNDKDLYNYFNLSQEEIDLIEETIK